MNGILAQDLNIMLKKFNALLFFVDFSYPHQLQCTGLSLYYADEKSRIPLHVQSLIYLPMYALKPLKDKRLLALWCEIALDTASSKDRPSKEKIIKKVYVLPILCIEKCRGLKKISGEDMILRIQKFILQIILVCKIVFSSSKARVA